MKTVILAVPAIVLMMAVPAYGQDPLRNAYGGAANVVTEVAGVVGSGGVTTRSAAAAETGGSVKASGAAVAPEVSQSVAPEVSQVAGVNRAGSATVPSGERSVGAPPAPQVKTSALGSLPFTGFDALLLLMGGTVLFAVGWGMRRLSQ